MVIPREGVERLRGRTVRESSVPTRVIPREGVESHERMFAQFTGRRYVIPREGVESVRVELDWSRSLGVM